jgi:hypothetical protein
MTEETNTDYGERGKNRGEVQFWRCCGRLLRCAQGALSLTFKIDIWGEVTLAQVVLGLA